MNTLVCIGYLGHQECYLNISEEEAKKRYLTSQEVDNFEGLRIKILEFKDNFSVYDIWSNDENF